MRVSLLDEVAAYADGTDTDLLVTLRPMNRLFVAVLALTPGRPAGMDRLTEQLWGDFPPADPRARLHSYAAKARACLKHKGATDPLVTQAGGYYLQVDGGSVDVHRFRERAAQARAFAVADDDVASLTRAALEEWGPGPVRLYGPEPLSGLPGQWAADYRVALRREHRDAVINLLTVEVRRGGAGRVLAQFAKLADADLEAREDEQFAALLMHAYYLCGRQAEAFKTYQRTTELLRNNGVEAGRELRMMEGKIRNQDADLNYPRQGEVAPCAHDLSPADNTDQYDGDKNDDAGAAAQEPADRGVAPDSSVNRGPTYSQRNIGRTVIANQGTQHVNTGGADG
jgi:DNA-binding SARP family transcriptional activator